MVIVFPLQSRLDVIGQLKTRLPFRRNGADIRNLQFSVIAYAEPLGIVITIFNHTETDVIVREFVRRTVLVVGGRSAGAALGARGIGVAAGS